MKSGPPDAAERGRLAALWYHRPDLSTGQIARLLDRNESTVRCWGNRWFGRRKDTRPPAWTPAEDARLLRLDASGLPYRRIAAALGRPFSGVQSRLRKIGGAPRRRLKDGLRAEALALLGERRPAREVAKALKVSAETVRRWRQEAGIPVFSYAERNARSVASRRTRGTLPISTIRWKYDRDRNRAAGWPWATTLQVAVLDWLLAAGRPATGEEVRLGLGIAPTSRVSNMLAAMARLGWVWRSKDDTDGRYTYYQIAEAVADRRRAFVEAAHAPQDRE